MAKTKEKHFFTPSGRSEEAHKQLQEVTKLPAPTKKTHKQLGLTDEEVVAMYKEMHLQRRFEERAAQMYQKGKFGGFLHLYNGQEAVSTGVAKALRKDDDIITAYRDHGWGLVRGISAKSGMCELYGKADGCSRGKGGSMHFANVKEHFWGGYGIVGGHIPLAGGFAMANKYNGNDRIAICFMGDGAVHQGAIHETFNMSQLWNLPVIYAVENNGYAMGTAMNRHMHGEIYERALAYRMKHAVINGMDVFTVYEEMKKIADDVRKNHTPYFVEIRTYRYRGHSMSDPQGYRTKDEVEEYKKVDPVEQMRVYVLKHKLIKEDALVAMEEAIEQEVLDAIDYAETAPFLEDSELLTDVFVENDYPFHT